MHDIKSIRNAPERFDEAMVKRGFDPNQSQPILALDQQHRQALTQLQALLQQRNQTSKQVGAKKAAGENADDLIKQVADIKAEIAALEQQAANSASALTQLLESLPNIPDDGVPAGADEESNVELRRIGKPAVHLSGFDPKSHDEIGVALGLMDFESAAKISGARFVVLKAALARLERAISSFMLDVHTNENGYMEISPPYLVRDDAMYGTGQLPKFAEDLFRVDQNFWLIPTAEVPLTNMVAQAILDEKELPLRMTALTPCFRSEAGAAGRDTRGLIRQHQFSKVELVSIVPPASSADELERMVNCAEMILKRLELPYRTMLLCAGDMGFGARKTYDIEVWLPEQKTYREISSCSNCGDFQARRMNARFKSDHTKGTEFIHSLNGSGLAVGRTMVAILENYQQADGSIAIPAALQPYMGGQTVISPLRDQ